MILGLTGRKRHGKDTFARILSERLPVKKLSFALRLKEICCKVYGLNWAQVDDEAGKEMLLPQPIDLDSAVGLLAKETSLPICTHGLFAKTPRQVLQYVGTDYVRHACPSYWVDQVRGQLSGSHGHFVITDVRFANEAAAIREVGGKVLRVLRLSEEMKDTKAPEHSSEALDFQADFTMAMAEGDFALPKFVCSLAGRDPDYLFPLLAAANWEIQAAMLPILVAYYRPIFPQMVETLLAAMPEPAR